MSADIKALHQDKQSNVPPMLLNLACLLAGGLALAYRFPGPHFIWTAVWVLWIAYFMHTWMTIFHEDVHHTLYQARWHNVFNGMIVGTLLLVPFSVYRQVHIRHHSRMNEPGDWEMWPYCDPRASLAFRRAFVVFDILLGWWAGAYIYNRIFFVPHSPVRDPKTRRRITYEYLLIAGFWSAVLAVVFKTGAWPLFLKVYVIPGFLAGVIQTFRKLTEHLGLPAGDGMAGARTVVDTSWLGRLLAYTSFHIFAHGAHHRYPQLPHRHLALVAREEGGRAPGQPVFASYWQAMRDMFPHLLNPGIGVNAPPVLSEVKADEPHRAVADRVA